MSDWRHWSFWVGPICTALYAVFLLFGLPYIIYQSVHDGFTKEEQLVLIGGLFVLVSLPMSVYLIYQHLKHLNRPNLQKPIIRILWMVPIYALDAWLALVLPSWTIYLDSTRECYEAYVIYNFMVYILEALCMEMDLLAVMKEKPQVKHFFPFSLILRNWDMGTEFVYKCKHGILQYAFFQPIITAISFICEQCGVYGKGTIAVGVAYPYLVLVTNISQTVAMYCLVLFYKANKNDMTSMRPLPKFICIKAVIFCTFFQGMVINVLVYYKVIKNIFGTNEQDDYQVLSEKLQNFLICIEMVVAAVAHHYSYPYQEHQINIPNYRPATASNLTAMLRSMLDTNDIRQDMREHLGAVKNSLLRPFRTVDESTLLFAGSSSSVYREPEAGPSRYGSVNFVASGNPRIPNATIRSKAAAAPAYHQGAPPTSSGMMFGSGHGRLLSLDSPPTTTTATSSNTQTVRKSDSGGSSSTNSWPSNSMADDVVHIEVKGLEENLIQLPGTPPV